MANRYQYGTGARKLYTVEPEYREEGRPKRQKRRRVSPASVALCVLYCGVVLFTLAQCVTFLHLQTQVTVLGESVGIIDKQIVDLRAQNDAVAYEISGYTDVTYVYQTAMDKLGMVEPSKEQIKYYTSEENEYVMQLGDIPEE